MLKTIFKLIIGIILHSIGPILIIYGIFLGHKIRNIDPNNKMALLTLIIGYSLITAAIIELIIIFGYITIM